MHNPAWGYLEERLRLRQRIFDYRDIPPRGLVEVLDTCRGLGETIEQNKDVMGAERENWIGNWIRESCGVLLDARLPDAAEKLWPKASRDGPKTDADLKTVMARLDSEIDRLDRP